MARNEEIEVYGIPSINVKRYNHHFTGRRKTTFNVGEIEPIYLTLLVQPGDTISMSMRSFLRLTTSLFPSMDNLTADVYAFAEDWQNVWEHTKDFWGEDEATPFESLPEYTVPQIVIEPSDEIKWNELVHHLAVPQMLPNKGTVQTEVRDLNVETEALSLRMYYDIYNRYFRDQNYIAKIKFSTGDEDLKYSEIENKRLLKAAKFHDYFHGTPEPQKGEPEFLPIGTEAPVYGDGTELKLTNVNGAMTQSDRTMIWVGQNSSPTDGYTWAYPQNQTGKIGIPSKEILNEKQSGLMVDLTNTIGATVNALRLITATQHIKEQLLWYGSRFEEIISSQWGVDINAATMRIPEYLGGKKIDINMDTVLQTSSTNSQSPQGNAAGYSVTLDEDFLFTKSFTTWNMIMIMIVIRQDHTYAQGLARQHQKKRKYDFFWREFEGLGAQPRPVSEICLNGNASDNNTWNFAPAWREYISEVDRAVGLMVPGVANSLANYTYTDEYTSIPNSGQEWIEEIPDYVDRTLVVPSTTTDQFMGDFVFEINKTSIIPNYRLPGLDKL